MLIRHAVSLLTSKSRASWRVEIPFLALRIRLIAKNHFWKSRWVWWNIVPTVTEKMVTALGTSLPPRNSTLGITVRTGWFTPPPNYLEMIYTAIFGRKLFINLDYIHALSPFKTETIMGIIKLSNKILCLIMGQSVKINTKTTTTTSTKSRE